MSTLNQTDPTVNPSGHMTSEELLSLIALAGEHPDGADDLPYEDWPEWCDEHTWMPTTADEEWWAQQDREGGCLASDLSPSDRRFSQCESATIHHRSQMGD